MELREQAYLYDLYITPTWRELFDRLVDEKVKIPAEGRFLEVECGSGGFALDLALRSGQKVEVFALDSDAELIALAREKARIKQAQRLEFAAGSLNTSPFSQLEFDLVIADTSLAHWRPPTFTLDDLAQLTRQGGTTVLKTLTRGSFDELFSIYWEALYNLGLITYSPQLEALIAERPTVGELEEAAEAAGLRSVQSVVSREVFEFPSGQEFFESPLIRTVFLDHWLRILPDSESRLRVQAEMIEIIDRERQGIDFDVSARATLVIGRK